MIRFRWAIAGSLALHLAALGLWASGWSVRPAAPVPAVVLLATLHTPPAEPPLSEPAPSPSPAPRTQRPAASPTAAPPARAKSGRAYMEAPPAPSAEDWALAATYTPKNAKRYRHNWGQQVRSLMGTAFEGPGQGSVRFRIEIASSGQIARLDTLWATSPDVEQRARQAVRQMPPLPPPPRGQPLVFEKTIVFDAFTAETPPLYKNDCEPDPPQHGNRFAWDGRSPQVVAEAAVAETLDPAAYAECLRQLPQDSIEAEAGDDQRQLEQWRSQKLGR
jgi:TonB family protein